MKSSAGYLLLEILIVVAILSSQATGQRQMRYRSGRYALDTPLRRLRYRMAAPHPEEESEMAKPPHPRAVPKLNGEHSSKPKRGVIKIAPVSKAEKKRAALKFRQLDTQQNYATGQRQMRYRSGTYALDTPLRRLRYRMAAPHPEEEPEMAKPPHPRAVPKLNSGHSSEPRLEMIKIAPVSKAEKSRAGLKFRQLETRQNYGRVECQLPPAMQTATIWCWYRLYSTYRNLYYCKAMCEPGYSSTSPMEMKCNYGQWSPYSQFPECPGGPPAITTGSCGVKFDATAREKNCKDSGNGLVTCYILCGSGGGFPGNDMVMAYACNNGNWSPTLPSCATATGQSNVGICSIPSLVTASMKCTQDKGLTTCKVLCKGESVMTDYVCSSYRWSPEPPICPKTGKVCNFPSVNGGSKACGGLIGEVKCAITCDNDGITRNYSCNSDDKWSPALPSCATTGALGLKLADGPTITTGSCGVRFDATATEKDCKDSGNGSVTCSILCGGGTGNVDKDVVMQYVCSNGVWSPALPRCATATGQSNGGNCPIPSLVTASMKCTQDKGSTTCKVLCKGESVMTDYVCSFYRWSPSPPTCPRIGKECNYPSISGGMKTCTSLIGEAICTITCNNDGIPRNYVCNSDEKWSPALPSCATTGAPEIDESEDCQLQQVGEVSSEDCTKDEAADLTTCFVLCTGGGDVPMSYVCSHGNSWSPALPSCVRPKGGPTTSTDCQWVGTGDMKAGSCEPGTSPLLCSFQCGGDVLSQSYVCKYGSKWTPALPSCITPKAGKDTGSEGCKLEKNMYTQSLNCTPSGDSTTCQVQCRGDDQIKSYVCSYGNNWSPTLPKCATAGGQPTKDNDQCDLEGVQGFKSATCGGHLLSGTTCEIECSSPPSQRSYTCTTGRKWSPKLPPCVIPKVRLRGPGCTLQGLQGFVNGSCSNNYQETTCSIQCDGQTGQTQSKCSVEQKTWTPALPDCVMQSVMLTNWNGDCTLQAVSALSPASKCQKGANSTTCNIQCDFGNAMTQYVCYYQNIWKPTLPSCVMPKAEEIP